MYVFTLLKCSIFNPDPIHIVNLIWIQHITEDKIKKGVNDCPCIWSWQITVGDL